MTTGTYITGITLPVPGTGGDTALVAANKIVTSLQAIDAHAHTGTDGRKLGIASFTVDANVSWNNYRIESLGSVTFQNVTTAPGISNNLYVSGGELWFRDNNSNNVKLTLNGVVNTAATGLIVGMTGSAAVNYLAGSNYFEFVDEDGGYADLKFGGVKLTNANGNIINILTDAPTSGYDITLPNADPAANQFLMSNGSGVLSWQYALVSDNSTLGANKLPYLTSSTTMAAFDVLGNGQLLIGTGGTPAIGTITGTADQIEVTLGSGSITLNLPQSIATTSAVAFTGITNYSNYTSTGNVAAVNGGFSGTLGVTGVVTLSNLGITDNRVVLADSNGILTAPYAINSASAVANSIVQRNGSGNIVANVAVVNQIEISGGEWNTNNVISATTINTTNGTITTLGSTTANLTTINTTTGNITTINNTTTNSNAINCTAGIAFAGGSDYFKVKKIQTTLSGTGAISIAHGLGSNINILGVTARVSDSVNNWYNLPLSVTNNGVMNLWVEYVNDTYIVFRAVGYSFAYGVTIVITYV